MADVNVSPVGTRQGARANGATAALRVILWSPAGSGLHYGGPGMTAFRLYRTAQKGRFAITLVHGVSRQERYDLFEAEHLLVPLKQSPIAQARFLWAARHWVAANARSFDVFHGLQGFHLTVAPALQAQRMGVPAVVKLALYRTDLADKSGWKALLRLPARRREMVKQLSGVIAISTHIRDELLGYGIPESKIAVIPNGVDCDQFRPPWDGAERAGLRERLGWRDRFTLMFSGAINRRKRPHLLVQALGSLRDRGVDCQLVLAGPEAEPEYARETRSLSRELGVEDRVIWTGFVQDVNLLYRAADLFVFPSSAEGMPNAVAEALASGLPVVSTKISGTSDMISDGVNGMFVKPQGVAIADAVQEYVRDGGLLHAHSHEARVRIQEDFSAQAVLDAHEQMFRRIMRGAPAAA